MRSWKPLLNIVFHTRLFAAYVCSSRCFLWLRQSRTIRVSVRRSARGHCSRGFRADAVIAVIIPAGKDELISSSQGLTSPRIAFTIYDHLLTISSEVNLIWFRKFHIITWVFLFNRYATLVKMILLFQTNWASSQLVRDLIHFYVCTRLISYSLTAVSYTLFHVMQGRC